jgi:hypothetical protein
VDDLTLLLLRIEVGDVQCRDGLQRQRQRGVGATRRLLSQVNPDLPQRAKDARAVEPLTLAVFAEI